MSEVRLRPFFFLVFLQQSLELGSLKVRQAWCQGLHLKVDPCSGSLGQISLLY